MSSIVYRDVIIEAFNVGRFESEKKQELLTRDVKSNNIDVSCVQENEIKGLNIGI